MGLINAKFLERDSFPYKKQIEELVSNEHLISLLADNEIASIKTNKEETNVICGDNIIKLIGAKSSTEANVWTAPNTISEICGSNSPKSVHYHGSYPSHLSESDRDAHSKLFSYNFGMGCAVGIDGIRCEVPSGHIYKMPWTDEFYERATEKGISIIDHIRLVTCSKLLDKKWLCDIHTTNGRPTFTNLFSEQIIEQDNPIKPYAFFGDDQSQTFMEKATSKKMTCVVSETDKPPFSEKIKDNIASMILLKGKRAESRKKKRVLTCFFRDE